LGCGPFWCQRAGQALDKISTDYNATTEKQSNYLRTDPPLLWRRCDAVAVAGLLLISATALAVSAWPASMVILATTVLYAPLAPINVEVFHDPGRCPAS